MQYFYSLCFLVGGFGFPVAAQAAVSSKAMATDVPASVAAAASVSTEKQSLKQTDVIVTSDLSRAAASAAVLAARENHAPATVTRTEPRSAHDAKKTKKTVAVATAKSRSSLSYSANNPPVRTDSPRMGICQRFARVTAYWASEGDYYTGRGLSATGVRLHDGLCAVDPNIIPYGSTVEIAGVGKYLAVDTGSAVIARLAAREGGHTSAERNAIVVDLFFESRRDGEKFAASAAKYASISWWTPMATNTLARAARSLFAEEDWLKIQSKQL